MQIDILPTQQPLKFRKCFENRTPGPRAYAYAPSRTPMYNVHVRLNYSTFAVCLIIAPFIPPAGESRSDDSSQKLTSNGTTTTGGNVADVSGNLGLIPSSGVTANGGFRTPSGALSSASARSGRGIQTHADGKVRRWN